MWQKTRSFSPENTHDLAGCCGIPVAFAGSTSILVVGPCQVQWLHFLPPFDSVGYWNGTWKLWIWIVHYIRIHFWIIWSSREKGPSQYSPATSTTVNIAENEYISMYIDIYIYMYVYIYICMYIYVYIYIHRYVYIYIYICIYRCIYIYVYIYIYICVNAYLYVCISMYVCLFIYSFTFIHLHIYIQATIHQLVCQICHQLIAASGMHFSWLPWVSKVQVGQNKALI